MLDFVKIAVTVIEPKKKIIIAPEFVNMPSKDLMIRGGSFYAVWDEHSDLWSTDEYKIEELIDEEIWAKYKEITAKYEGTVYKVSPLTLSANSTKKWAEWKNFAKNRPDKYHQLDNSIIFANNTVKKNMYVSKKLPYAIEEGDLSAYDEIMSTLYDPEERAKLEWAIGAIISGDSKKIQKFIVLYGEPGSGKSTVLNIIQMLFEGYWTAFDAKALGQASNAFALEAFRANPLIAIQHDGDLSRIEDNTKLNSVVAHETMLVNEKRKTQYAARFNSFLFMGTNKPVKITDAKSGIIRRLIDVRPSGRRLPSKRYFDLMNKVEFELGAIAYHCLEVYKGMGAQYFNGYKPNLMMGETNDFYNFILENFEFFSRDEEMTLTSAWKRYKDYCDEAAVPYPYSKRAFKNELKNYYEEFKDRSNGCCNIFRGFREDKLVETKGDTNEEVVENDSWIELSAGGKSILDSDCGECPAQYTTKDGNPLKSWDKVTTKLKDLDTGKLHFVKVPKNHIVIDFDLKDENGNKSLERNLAAASKWPKTYAEVSKGGQGLHLHYIYNGDISLLSNFYEDNPDIEVKLPIGDSTIRRKLTKFCNFAIATISSGLTLKGVKKKVVNEKVVHDEKWIRKEIIRSLKKEHPGLGHTKPEIDWIDHILDEAYTSGMQYDVTDLQADVETFAFNSSNNKKYCEAKVTQMKFKSDEMPENTENYVPYFEGETPLVFFDVEVAPNKFLIVWKQHHVDAFHKMLNPKPEDVEKLFKFKLVGFNNRAYDNHILYGWAIDRLNNEGIYQRSKAIIDKKQGATYGAAYNISYADIFEFCSKKQSLKKWEIELGIHHQELGIPWDEPISDEMEDKWIEYCCNDVAATEALFDARKEDFNARKILAELSGMTVNDTTRMHATKIIFGNDKNPKLVYTDLSTIFPGYTFDKNRTPKSDYMGDDPSEGGYVYAEPGIYTNVALLDIASLHPHSAIELNIFGEYTGRFEELVEGRLAVKHRDFEKMEVLLDGALEPYIGSSDEDLDALAYALKIVINSVYGFTSATFPNPFKDPRNVDNIVAKRGALFMIQLKHKLQDMGVKVVHIKTDSIKIPNASPEIISFIMEEGKKYGYTFEHEATYDRMCLVNDAVYIAKYKDGKHAGEWTATGTQFQVPFVFKTLFSKEEVTFDDMCETKSTSKGLGLYLDMNEGLPEGEHNFTFIGKVGRFTPIKPGSGGGELVRESNGKYNAATGTKGYRWLESEMVKLLGKEDDIDKSYYISLCDAAIDTINKYGDFNAFVSESPYLDMSFMNIPEDAGDDGVPW